MLTLTIERLRHRFNYDPETGVFTRRSPSDRRFHDGQVVGHASDNGYIHFSIDNKKYGAHRLAWFYVHGEWPTGDIDHINGDRADNRIANLRDVSRSVNLQNQRAPKSHNKSTGILGAHLHTQTGRFTSRIRVNGQNKHLGCFATAEQAHVAYVAAKRELHEGNTL